MQNFGYKGIDQSEELIKIAQKDYPTANFQVANIFNLPFDDGRFDVAAGIAFFHHIPSRELRLRVLQEMARVLKPGGILFFTNWNLRQPVLRKKYKLRCWDFFFPHNNMDAGDFWIAFQSKPRYYHHFGKGELTRLAKAAGFAPEKYAAGKNNVNVFRKLT
jgi:ubiquinone/menaquinone biosynthesis C-methylase UbiE